MGSDPEAWPVCSQPAVREDRPPCPSPRAGPADEQRDEHVRALLPHPVNETSPVQLVLESLLTTATKQNTPGY